jgi:molybdopterin-synthase adenylyltransferase
MSDPTHHDDAATRYSRQILYENIGPAGQEKLAAARVTLIGCGALGTVLADTLVRAGVGFLRICDRDFIERNNLQRQILFDEDDIAADLPKAEAAAQKLRRINPDVEIEAVVDDVNQRNIESLCAQAGLLLDGTDNFETRFLINDLAVRSQRPWVYGAVIGATGLCMPILPNDTPCLRCVFESAPPPEMNPTCDTAGVLGPAVGIVAGFQAIEAMKILAGRREAVTRALMNIDVWSGRLTPLNVQSAYDKGTCPCCRKGRFDYLEGDATGSTTTLCGRDAVQISRPSDHPIEFEPIAQRLAAVVGDSVRFNNYLLRCKIEKYELTLFADGRAIVKGTKDANTAKSIYAKYIGA